MSKFNKNNPTDLWCEDEKYEFSKLENKWIKKMAKNSRQQTAGRVFGSNDDPTFSSVEEINRVFLDFIQRRKVKWRFLCNVCDYATDLISSFRDHKNVHANIRGKNISRKAALKCKKCPEIFENLTKRDKHFDAKHRERIIRCDECPQIFHTYYKKNVHKRSVHEKSDKKLNV